MTTWRWVMPCCRSLWWICSRSAVKTGRPLIRRRMMESEVSRMGRPKETTGMATATMVGAFCAPSRASALEQETDKEAAGVSEKDGCGIEVVAEETENRAGQRDGHYGDQRRSIETAQPRRRPGWRTERDPAARPSRPSIRLKALVMASTQRTVKGSPTNQGKPGDAEQHRNVDDAQAAANSMVAAMACTANLK